MTLWEMVTGHALFRGSPAEVMYQHQHAPLPLEQLEGVPQPIVVLLEVLLEKDPRATFPDTGRTPESDADDTGAIDSAVKSLVRASARLPMANLLLGHSEAAGKAGTEENFNSQIAHYRKRCFRSRRGYRFPG